jgi:membrane protein YqaA with SNARE-associated domain
MAAAYYPLAVMSALAPWVNGELVMLSAVPLAHSSSALGVIVGVMTAGQMTGKAVMFWAARTAKAPRAPRVEAVLDRWRVHLACRPRSATGLMCLSAMVGLPPFYLVSIAAGALGVGFGRFLVIGFVGRLVHFGVVAFAPHLVWRG